VIKLRVHVFIIVILFLANIWVWPNIVNSSDEKLVVNFFDVGQGDAALIEAPNNFQVLIDGGPDNSILTKLGLAMPKSDKIIELIVISHPDKDHISGLVEVLRRYKVENVLATLVEHDLADYEEFKKLIKEKSIPVVLAKTPMRLYFGESYIDILHPFEVPTGMADDINTNATSIVAKLVYGSDSVLFTGDLEDSQERGLLLKSLDVDSDILKAAHHGSKSSSGEEFLKAVSPEYAVISAGRNNRYGHPHQEVVERLKAFGASVLATSQLGDIVFESEGFGWRLVEN